MAKKAAKRELIDTGKDKRFVRRDDQGQFKESADVGQSRVDRMTQYNGEVHQQHCEAGGSHRLPIGALVL